MPDQVWLGQFNIVAGQVQEDGPYAGAVTDRTVADSIADLYVALQPTRPDTDQLCAGVMQAVGRAFGHAQFSVTGNLLIALGQAHHNLREWNRSSLPEHRMGVGISTMAIAGDEAYLAQTGPSVAYYRHNGRVERLEPLEPESRTPLGQSETLSPWFHRLKLTRGDAVVLLSGGITQQTDPRIIEQCLSLSPELGLPELFRRARGVADCGALLVSVLDDIPGPADEEEQPTEPPARPPGATAAPPRPDRLPRPPAERDRPLPEPPIKEEKPRRAPSPLGRNPFRRVQARHPDEGQGVLRVIGAEKPRRPFRGPANALANPEEVLAAAAAITRTHVRIRTDPPGFRSSFAGFGGRRRSLRPFVVGGAGLALLVLGAWYGVPAMLNSSRTARFSTLLTSARAELSQAEAESDLGKRRELLNQALSNVDEAHQLKPNDQRAASEATNVADALTVMNAVYPLPDVPTIADLAATGLSNSSTVEVAAGDAVYVLDVTAGKVFSVSRDAGAPSDVVYEEGSDVDGVHAAKAHHIAWVPSTGPDDSGTLLVLDTAHHLFGLSHHDLRAVPLRGVDQWRADTAMSVSGGALYVLDAPSGLVWRYEPSGVGFDTDPAPAIARADIRDATGISVVGGIFLTGQDGRIRRFLDGGEGAFKLAGIDKPPAAPQPPLYDPASGAVYLTDRANSRIVVIEANGNFKRQLTHARLAGLRGAAVDAGQSRLVGVIGQAVVAIPLPH